jgi:hypothetical protein
MDQERTVTRTYGSKLGGRRRGRPRLRDGWRRMGMSVIMAAKALEGCRAKA